MRTRLQEVWANGEGAVNGWLSMPNTITAELMARAGFDTLTIDLQHGLNDYLSALQMLQTLEIEIRPVDLSGLVGEMLELLASSVPEKCELVRELDPELSSELDLEILLTDAPGDRPQPSQPETRPDLPAPTMARADAPRADLAPAAVLTKFRRLPDSDPQPGEAGGQPSDLRLRLMSRF